MDGNALYSYLSIDTESYITCGISYQDIYLVHFTRARIFYARMKGGGRVTFNLCRARRLESEEEEEEEGDGGGGSGGGDSVPLKRILLPFFVPLLFCTSSASFLDLSETVVEGRGEGSTAVTKAVKATPCLLTGGGEPLLAAAALRTVNV